MRKAVQFELSKALRLEHERGYRRGEKHRFGLKGLALFIKAEGLSTAKVGDRTGMEQHTVRKWLK